MDRYFRVDIALSDLSDLTNGFIKSEVISVRYNELFGLYLDYSLARIHEDLLVVRLIHTPGFRPERVEAGMSVDRLEHWHPTRSREQAALLVRRYLGRELLQDEFLVPVLQEVIRVEIGEEIDLPVFVRPKD